MDDPYWRYSHPPSELGSTPKARFPGYLSSEASTLTTHHHWTSNDVPGSSDFVQKEFPLSRPGAYGVDRVRGMHAEPFGSGLTSGISNKGYPSPVREPSLLVQRRDVTPGMGLGIHEQIYERPNSLRRDVTPGIGLGIHGKIYERPSPLGRANDLPAAESNILFVDGLPTDCSRREVGHLFRPFIGFRDLKVVHKEPRQSGDKAMVLCFVEFADPKSALTAMEALQGYKFDDRKPDSSGLKIHFAHFPFRLPSSDQEDQRFGSVRQS